MRLVIVEVDVARRAALPEDNQALGFDRERSDRLFGLRRCIIREQTGECQIPRGAKRSREKRSPCEAAKARVVGFQRWKNRIVDVING